MAFLACPNKKPTEYIKHIQDIDIIPDKHNCGLSNPNATFTVFALDSGACYMPTEEGVQLPFNATSEVFRINPYSETFWKGTTPATYTVKDCDFSAAQFTMTNESVFGARYKVIFKNCKFSAPHFCLNWGEGKNYHGIETVFEHCDFTNEHGIFECVFTEVNYCTFHNGHGGDFINPKTNMHFNHCYFYDILQTLEFGKGIHLDGFQCFGDPRFKRDGEDVAFYNCRFELPDFYYYSSEKQSGDPYVNSCMSMALEYSGLSYFSVNNCHINGGGYSIYAPTSSHKQDHKSFQNIKVGSLKRFGIRYNGSKDLKALWEDVVEEDKLIVSSVWKENGTIHFLVSNEIAVEKTLIAVTDSGTEYTFTIPQNYTGTTVCDLVDKSFDVLPFDIEKTISENANYVVFYDTTVATANQIRFEDFV